MSLRSLGLLHFNLRDLKIIPRQMFGLISLFFNLERLSLVTDDSMFWRQKLYSTYFLLRHRRFTMFKFMKCFSTFIFGSTCAKVCWLILNHFSLTRSNKFKMFLHLLASLFRQGRINALRFRVRAMFSVRVLYFDLITDNWAVLEGHYFLTLFQLD